MKIQIQIKVKNDFPFLRRFVAHLILVLMLLEIDIYIYPDW